MIRDVEPREANSLITAGWTLIDVRSPAEWRAVHAAEAVNIPLDTLDEEKVRKAAKNSRVLFICQGGGRSRRASEQFAGSGLEAIANVLGGTKAWEASGLDVVRGKGVISIERQMRITAGALVLAGTLCSLWIHPAFIAVPLFVGAGLIFAGVTDTCAMGMLLARMPWNRGK